MYAPRAALAIAIVTTLIAAAPAQRRWAQYEREMQNPAEDPPDAWEPAEFAFARLRFRSPQDGFYRKRWGTDANKSDRFFMQSLRRLTRVHTRSVEQIVDIGSDDIFDWPWAYAVGAGDWRFTKDEATRLGAYLNRGGFLMVDDFHNEYEWETFMEGIRMALPKNQVIELPDDHPIFQTVFDLQQRHHIPGLNILRGSPWERGGVGEHWRAVIDEKGRVQVAICFNMDLGDAWEWADRPDYPERYSSLAFRISVNYVIYAMTH
jgi:hypothetical protein